MVQDAARRAVIQDAELREEGSPGSVSQDSAPASRDHQVIFSSQANTVTLVLCSNSILNPRTAADQDLFSAEYVPR